MSTFKFRPTPERFMADVMPRGIYEFELGESLVVCRVTEIKRSKPEMIIFTGKDSTQTTDFTYFKNGLDFSVDAGDFVKCKVRYKPTYRNFTASQIRKIDEDEADLFAFECLVNREKDMKMRAGKLPPNLGGNYLISDLYTNVKRKPTSDRNEVKQKIFESLFFGWVEWGSSHAQAQPKLRFNELMESTDLQRLVEETADEEAVREVLQEVLDMFQQTNLLRFAQKAPEIDLKFFRNFPEWFLSRLRKIGPIELDSQTVFHELNSSIPGNTKRLVSYERFQGFMKELFENGLLDFPNDPRNFRLKEL